MIAIGDEQIYRLRDYDHSERVRLVEIDSRKKTPRYVVEFLEGEKQGQRENVPLRRLRGDWAEVAAYDDLMANWQRLEESWMEERESDAADVVFERLIDSEIATGVWTPVRGATKILNADGLAPLLGIRVEELLAQVDWFVLDGETIISPAGTMLLAQYACQVNPMPVLDWVVEEEKEYRHYAKHCRASKSFEGEEYTTSPEWEYKMYLEYGKPLHEILRAWCGYRAVTFQERLEAAEAEVRRVDELITRLFEQLKSRGEHSASVDVVARAYEEERITPHNYRPVVDRPLKPNEIPVRYVNTPRRWPRY